MSQTIAGTKPSHLFKSLSCSKCSMLPTETMQGIADEDCGFCMKFFKAPKRRQRATPQEIIHYDWSRWVEWGICVFIQRLTLAAHGEIGGPPCANVVEGFECRTVL